MATATTNYTCRVDNEVKAKSEALFSELGMNLGTAINVFLREAVRVGGFPFELRLDKSNRETIEAMLEAEKIAKDPNVKKFTNTEEALAELKK